MISLTINQSQLEGLAEGQIQIGATKIGQLVITPLTRIYYDNIYMYMYHYMYHYIYIYIHIYS